MSDTKTYVFGQDNNSMMSMLAPLLQQRGLDPNLLLTMCEDNDYRNDDRDDDDDYYDNRSRSRRVERSHHSRYDRYE